VRHTTKKGTLTKKGEIEISIQYVRYAVNEWIKWKEKFKKVQAIFEKENSWVNCTNGHL